MNTHGIAGLLAGVRYLMEEERWKNFQEKELRLAELFYRELKDCPKFIFYGDPAGGLRVPVISLNLREEDSGEVSDWLFHEYGICTRPGGHCAPLMHEFFHTERQGMVRFSFFSWKHRGGGAPGGGGLKRDDRAVGLFCLLLFCFHLFVDKNSQ